MASHRTSVTKGFSLIEILVVIGMLAIVGSFGLFLSMESFQHSIFKNDRDLLIDALYKARAQSVNNMCFGTCSGGQPHGVHIGNGAYTVFQGLSYTAGDPQNEVTAANPGTTVTGATDIVFDRISGITTPVTLTVTSVNGQTSTISVRTEGGIGWTQ